MFQETIFPAAFHEFLKMALSPCIVMCSFLAANSLSKSVAEDSIFSFSLKRLPVSFTTAKASGKISRSTSSIFSSRCFFSSSISLYNTSLPLISSGDKSSAASFFSEIKLSIAIRCVLILALNSIVLLRSSSLESDWYFAKNSLTFAI